VIRTLTQSELESFPSLEWPDIVARISLETRAALDQVLETQDGGHLSREQCLLLANVEGDDLLGLLVAADTLRRDLVGNLVTYVVNRNINFTNVCFVGCKFCAFSRGPREGDTYFLSLEQLAQKTVEAWQLGATEVCIQGGLPLALSRYSASREKCRPRHAHSCFFSHGDRLRRRTHRNAIARLSIHVARQRTQYSARHRGGNSR